MDLHTQRTQPNPTRRALLISQMAFGMFFVFKNDSVRPRRCSLCALVSRYGSAPGWMTGALGAGAVRVGGCARLRWSAAGVRSVSSAIRCARARRRPASWAACVSLAARRSPQSFLPASRRSPIRHLPPADAGVCALRSGGGTSDNRTLPEYSPRPACDGGGHCATAGTPTQHAVYACGV